ncbi:MAG: YihY family inner membrane protein [Alphaproteobacteria bacterium]|nr:YihY family inner membrane protein [Alphaproteobacteria bacterium]
MRAPTPHAARGALGFLWRLTRSLMRAASEDALVLVSAGVAFFGLLALFPAISATVAFYGLLGDDMSVAALLRGVSRVAPGPAIELLRAQMTRLIEARPDALAVSGAVSALVSFWSAMQGMRQLLRGIGVAANAKPRPFLKSLAMTAAYTTAAVLCVGAIGLLLTVAPLALEMMPPRMGAESALRAVRWAALIGVSCGFIAALYRWGPHRARPARRRLWPGALAATAAWLGASWALSAAVRAFAQFHAVYGSLTGVVALLLWMYVSALIVLLGARLNTELEALDALRAAKAAQDELDEPSSAARGA